MQDAKNRQKNRHLRTIVQLCLAISSQLRHISVNRKKVLSSNIFSRCPHNIVNFGLLTAEIGPVVSAPQLISTGFASWQHYCMSLRAPPVFGRAAITLDIDPQSSFILFECNVYNFLTVVVVICLSVFFYRH